MLTIQSFPYPRFEFIVPTSVFLHSVVYLQQRHRDNLPHQTTRRKTMEQDKKRTDIALFRYALIAPVIQQNVTAQAEYFRGFWKTL